MKSNSFCTLPNEQQELQTTKYSKFCSLQNESLLIKVIVNLNSEVLKYCTIAINRKYNNFHRDPLRFAAAFRRGNACGRRFIAAVVKIFCPRGFVDKF